MLVIIHVNGNPMFQAIVSGGKEVGNNLFKRQKKVLFFLYFKQI